MEINMPEGAKQKSIEVFCCYARTDQPLLLELKKHLAPLQRERLITLWADVDIDAGTEWEKEIHYRLNTAQIVLLLISADFMDSEYCYSVEMKRAMERHEHGEARVIPIILRPVSWQGAPFGKLQVLPTNAEPIISRKWHHQDEAFYDVVKGIKDVLGALQIEEGKRRKSTEIKQLPAINEQVPRPELHSPAQSERTVAPVPLFPKLRTKEGRSRLAKGVHEEPIENLLSSSQTEASPIQQADVSLEKTVLGEEQQPASILLAKQELQELAFPSVALTQPAITNPFPPMAISPQFTSSPMSQDSNKLFIDATRLAYEQTGNDIHNITWSPDRTYIASVGDDSTIRIWNTTTGKTLVRIRGNLRKVAWSPDGHMLATIGNMNGTIQLWEAMSGKLIHSYEEGISGSIDALVWSPDGYMLATIKNGTIQIWEVISGKLLLLHSYGEGVSDSRHTLVWSPGGRLLASGGYEGVVNVWEAISGKLLYSYKEGAYGSIDALAWSPDGHMLASGGENGTVQVREAVSGKLLCHYEGHFTDNEEDYSKDGPQTLSLKMAQRWKAATNKLFKRAFWDLFPLDLLDLRSLVPHVRSIEWSPNSYKIASLSSSKCVHVWRATSGEHRNTYSDIEVPDWWSNYLWPPVWLDVPDRYDSHLLTLKNDGGIVQVWDVTSGEHRPLHKYRGHSFIVDSVIWSPDGRLLASVSRNRVVQIWDVTVGRQLQNDENLSYGIYAVAWSRDGRLLTAYIEDGKVQVWDGTVGSKKQILDFEGNFKRLRYDSYMVWSPDGLSLAVIRGTIWVWDVPSGKLLSSFNEPSDISVLVWSPDGRQIAVGNSGGTIQVWHVSSGKLLNRYEDHFNWGIESKITSIVWSPDGRLLASTSENSKDTTVHIWEAMTGHLLTRYESLSPDVRAMAWSPDGRQIALTSDNNTVQVWEVANGKTLITYHGHITRVNAVRWSPDGKYIASAAHEVHVWRAS